MPKTKQDLETKNTPRTTSFNTAPRTRREGRRKRDILVILVTVITIPLLAIIRPALPSSVSKLFTRMTATDTTPTNDRAPALFIPHGGGPMPLLNDPNHAGMIKFLTGPARKLTSLTSSSSSSSSTQKPKAILLITAHWETTIPTISSSESHDLYYDYYGFPPSTYEIKYPAPGSPTIALRAKELLVKGGFDVKLDEKRGWDHGVFVPLKILHPDADLPVVQMSVLRSQNAEEHLKMGEALAPLRDEGVLIIGSGMTFHNMGAIRSGMMSKDAGKNTEFHRKLKDVCESDGRERVERLKGWEGWEGARYSQPLGRSEHFMPLLVVAGAGGDGKGEQVLDWNAFGHKLAAFIWK